MYFKRLEMVGFKSFASKTKLNFEPGVTAIVGPNGCGKSNVSDAMKWVLGEQSAKELRGSRMEDVIFNGTSTKEPINMAEVSLVLSNEDKSLPIDFEEVIITRRLFRSGESEYLLNKMPVRLKDINELLAGTGLGTSSYSIIEQGKIGQILSSKAEERRHIFEEASGITKYKIKKKEALRKLEHTENNLLRINDIIQEVERQIKSIERQARKAEKYKQEFAVLKENELKLSSFDYKNISSELKTIELEDKDLNKREEELSHSTALLEEELKDIRRQVEAVFGETQECEKEIMSVSSSLEMNIHTESVNKERIAELENMAVDLEKEIEILSEKSSNRLNEIGVKRQKLESVQEEKGTKEEALSSYREKVASLSKTLEENIGKAKQEKNKAVDCISSQTKYKNELIKLGADIQNKKFRLRRLRIEKDNISQESGKMLTEKSEIEKAFEEKRHAVNGITEKKNKLTSEINDLRTMLSKTSELINKSINEKDASRSELEILKDLVSRNEGFSSGVKTIKDAKPEIKSLCEIITVRQKYSKAVEAVLGEMQQALVVNNYEEALGCTRDIPRNQSARTVFLLLNEIPAVVQEKEQLSDKGCSFISEAVKTDEKYRDLVNHVFKNIIIARDRQSVDRLYSEDNSRHYVSPDGYLRGHITLISKTGTAEAASLINRKERIQELEGRISILEASVEKESASKVQIENSISDIDKNIELVEADLKTEEKDAFNIGAKKDALTDEIKKVEDESYIVTSEIDELDNDLGGLVKKGEELNEVLNKAEDEISLSHSIIANCESAQKELSQQREHALMEVTKLTAQVGAINSTWQSMQDNLDAQQRESDELKKDIESKQYQLVSSKEKVESLKYDIKNLFESRSGMEEKKKTLDESRNELITKKNIKSAKLNEAEGLFIERKEELEQMKNSKRDTTIKISDVSHKKSSLIEKILQLYKVHLDEVNVEYDEGTDWSEVKEAIEQMKEKIEKMGPVNLVAIEEHKELEDRYSFLVRQREDLVNAKDSLHKAIVKINATTKKLFLETFQKVQLEFKNYYRMLFGGGHAELFLLDEKDILESGVEIVVRPPGKKLQNILLLSGGEKALTAIALLFAIFKVNPSPFCILDEIDAPLDETNIDRFTRVLQEFVKISQFILITHSKKTMQMADIIFGITMAQKGVSRIVSVKFGEDKSQIKHEQLV